jgi:hypothetical protein
MWHSPGALAPDRMSPSMLSICVLPDLMHGMLEVRSKYREYRELLLQEAGRVRGRNLE